MGGEEEGEGRKLWPNMPDKQIEKYSVKKNGSMPGPGDGSVDKVFAVQVGGSEFGFPEPT